MNWFYPQPTEVAQTIEVSSATDAEPATVAKTREGGLTDPAAIAQEEADLETSLVAAERVKISAPEVTGSINPVGARIDDITLTTHREEVDKDSGPVRIFSPAGTPAQQYAQFTWVGEGVKVPTNATVWQAEGGPLSPTAPVTLTYDNGEGQLFTILLTIDDHYMITAEQTIANTSAGPIVVNARAGIVRTSNTASLDTWNVHSGPIGNFGEAVQFGPDYDDLAEDASEGTTEGRAAWLGFTDIYWLSALIPQEKSDVATDFRSLGNDLFVARMTYQPVTVAAGKQVTRTTQLFAGAKETQVLDMYEEAGVSKFGKAIDWGWFSMIAWPIWWLLTHLFALVGNFGVAIILMTFLIRLVLFPIAQKQFASMAAMKAIQPKMKAIQERYKDDKQEQQKKIMALYKEEKVNPLAGCMPILIQIPIFFALYKTLILAIEMRHQPFVLWLKDLSAPDPAHILNLFGALPFEVPALIAIGPLAVLLGITMWLTFRMNPTAMDPMQKQIFAIMPWMLMFVMAGFASGLLLYWVTNNVLTLAQQTYLYSRHPQLKAAAEKEKADKELTDARDAKGKA
ncbi:membrane protein insertase YidC [Pontixanthobacter gangjinensis]